jgi:hypothetical protein
MAKITRHGGPTVETVRVLLPGVVDLEQFVAERFPDHAKAAELAASFDEEDTCPGSSSETSPVKPLKSDEPPKVSRRSRARAVANPSKPTKGSTTASSTGTSTPETDG